MKRHLRWVAAGILAAGLVGLAAGGALAHKGKLPEDALTLVRQAAALLAQNPGMTGEVRERLQAALKSKKPAGVHLDQVAEALRALEKRDVAGARRLLLAAIMPAGMPMPPEGPGRPAAQMPAPPESAAAAPGLPPAAQPSPPSVDETMRMGEPLRARFTGSAAEVLVAALGLALIGAGVLSLWSGREAGRS